MWNFSIAKTMPVLIAVTIFFSPIITSKVDATIQDDWSPKISLGGSHTCAIRNDNSLWCWGMNVDGQIGNSDTQTCFNGASHFCQEYNHYSWTKIASGSEHTCAIRSNSTLWCWGRNNFGQLGNNISTESATTKPTLISSQLWSQISAGDRYTCGIRSAGSLWCWGRNSNGQLGVNDKTNRTTPTQVGTTTNWTAISTASGQTCGIQSPGTLWCWGRWGTNTSDSLVPVKVQDSTGTAATDWKQVSIGGNGNGVNHICGIRGIDALYCFGWNSTGELGLSDSNNRQYPTRLTGAWSTIVTGANHTCAIKSLGVFCWGDNQFGQLGSGDYLVRDKPTREYTAGNWTSVFASSWHTCARKSDFSISCWGNNTNAQLGRTTALNWDSYPEIVKGASYNSSRPTIAGIAKKGQILTANEGTWAGRPTPSISYQWYSCTSSQPNGYQTSMPSGCTTISGANSRTFTIPSNQVGKFLLVQVAASQSAITNFNDRARSATTLAITN